MNDFQPVIVVEGNHDKSKILQVFPDADIMTTNGSEISDSTLQALKHANKSRGLILMLDPDAPGERIRKRIVDTVGPAEHVFMKKGQCVDHKKRKVGIEHASASDIEKALSSHVVKDCGEKPELTISDLHALGLTGTEYARERRKKVTDHFSIGHANSKTLITKLAMFGITKKALERVVG